MRLFMRFLVLFALAQGLTACASTGRPHQASTPPTSGAGVERLLMPFSPSAWKLANHQEDGTRMLSEFVPPGEEISSWNRLLTAQIFRGPTTSPSAFYERMGEGFRNACTSSRLLMLPKQSQRGYDVHIALIYCGQNPETGRGEVVHFKVVRGRDALYVTQFAQRTAPFDASGDPPVPTSDIRHMIETLRDTVVCMDGGPSDSCGMQK